MLSSGVQLLLLLSLLTLLLTLSRPAWAQIHSDSGAAPDAAVQPPIPAATCPHRYLLYSVQSGEGFSLRRDAFVRMAVSLMLSKHHATGAGSDGGGWTLVLPPLSSRLSPHWHQGLHHGGIHYTEHNVPWRELWDMEFLANQTGLRFIEFAQFAATSKDGSAPATAVPEGAPATVDQVLHLCSFSYSSPFFEQGRLAGLKQGARNFPGSSFARSHVFNEFSCAAQPDPDVGFCPNAMPPIIDVPAKRSNGATSPQQAIVMAEYGSIRLSRSAHDSVHCGHANLMPPILPHLLDEYVSPAVSTPSGQPLCSVLVTNSQLVFWPAPPYPGARDTADPAVATHIAKNLFLRSLRLSPMLLAIAHTFVRHALHASTAMPLSSTAALAALQSQDHATASSSPGADLAVLPPYLSFHVRRGDFKRVHASVVPDLDHLAVQIVRRFRAVWQARTNATAASASPSPSQTSSTPVLSNRVFLSSDMSAAEFQQLQGFMQQAQVDAAANDAGATTSSPPAPSIELVRFDLERIRADLRPHFSAAVNAYLDGAAARAALHASSSRPIVTAASHHSTSGVVPLTPFHVLLLDQFIAEQSLARVGFVGTRHSYVSEMVWQQRRAWQIEDLKRWEKDVLEGGPLPKPTTNEKSATNSASTPTGAAPAAHARKDEL